MKFIVEKVGPIGDSVFELPDRGIVILYGPNASGKTLLSLCISSYFLSDFLVSCSHKLFGGGFADRILDEVWSRVYRTCDYEDLISSILGLKEAETKVSEGELIQYENAFRRYIFHAEFLRNIYMEDKFYKEEEIDSRKLIQMAVYRAVYYGDKEYREPIVNECIPLTIDNISKLNIFQVSEEKCVGINITDSAINNLLKIIEKGGAIEENMVIPSIMLLYVVRFLKQISFEESFHVIQTLFKVLADSSKVVKGIPEDLNVMYEGGRAYVKVHGRWISIELLSHGLKRIYALYEVAKVLPWIIEVGYKPILYIEEPESHLESIIVYRLPIFFSELIYRYNSIIIITTHSPEVFYGVEKCLDEGVLRSGDVYVYETVREGGFFKLR
ncbi:MAG: hypothetical protein DRJ52_05755, partial [Thermoprotei archaeon]